AGRAELMTSSFEFCERKIRDQLARIFQGGGFDPARDIEAIIINRWPHGYGYEYNPLFDPQWPAGQAPHEIGRKPFGRITIANSRSPPPARGPTAYPDAPNNETPGGERGGKGGGPPPPPAAGKFFPTRPRAGREKPPKKPPP